MRKIKPTLYIGLGKAGASLISACATILKQRNPVLNNAISDLCLLNDGSLKSYFNGNEYLNFKFLKQAEQNIYKHNYEQFIQQEPDIISLVKKQLNAIGNIESRKQLIKAGFEIGDPQVVFVTPLGDEVGSAVLLGFAKIINRILQEGNYAYSQTTAIYLLPDLFFTEADLISKNNDTYEIQAAEFSTKNLKADKTKHYARAYAALNEIDFTLDSNEVSGTKIIKHNFVVGSKNNINISLGSYNDMMVSLVEFALMLVNEQFATQHLNVHLENDTDGKTNRYSSIGFSTLVLPKAKMLAALYNNGKKEILHAIQTDLKNNKFDINTVNGTVKHYFTTKNLTQLVDRIALESDTGKPIFSPFTYAGKKDETVEVQHFFNSVNEASKNYENNVYGKTILNQLSNRKQNLTQQLVNEINTQTEEFINSPNQGINFAHAFTSLLLNKDCDSLTGQLLEDNKNLTQVEDKILGFYKSKLATIELANEHTPSLSAYIKNKEKRLNQLVNEVAHLNTKLKIENQKVAQNEMLTTVDLSNLKAEIQSKQDTIKQLKNEVATETSTYESGQKNIEDLKRKLESNDFRKSIRQQDLENIDDKKEGLKNQLNHNDNRKTIIQNKIDTFKTKRDKLLKKLFLFFPILIFGIPSAIITVLHIRQPNVMYQLFTDSETSAFEVYGSLFTILFIGYAIWAFLRYQKLVGKPMKILSNELNNINTKKINLINQYLNTEGESHQLKFNHLQHANAYDSLLTIKKAVENTNEQLNGFKNEILNAYKNATHKFENINLTNNLFKNNIITKADLDNYKEPVTAADFFVDKEGRSVVNYYKNYASENKVTSLQNDLDAFFATQYRHLANKNVYDFLFRDDYLNTNDTIETRMNLINEASQVYINLKDFGTGDQTEEKCDLFLFETGGKDAQQLTNALAEQGFRAESKIENSDKNRISIFRAKRGFPAFKITLIQNCKNVLAQHCLDKENIEIGNFYIYEKAIENDLYPSKIVLGNKNDLVRINYLKGVVLGFISSKTKTVFLEDNKIGNDQKDAINYLKSVRGEKAKQRLFELVQQKINTIEQNNTESELSSAVNQLIKSNVKLDEVDEAILDDWLKRLI